MKIQHVFTNFIAMEFLNIDNEALEVYCKKQPQPNINDPANRTHSTCLLDKSAPELQPLLTAVSACFNELHYKLGFRKDSHQEIINVSVNLGNNPVIDSAHCHPGWFFSGVYYVKAEPGSGSLNFISPISPATTTILPIMLETPNGFTGSVASHDAQTGKLLIFPSWLLHFVSSSLPGAERISMAFNTRIIMPEGIMDEYR
jgi:uncharacterized protein (TIGR02466 family)